MSRRTTDLWPSKKPGSSCWMPRSTWFTHGNRLSLREAFWPRCDDRYESPSMNAWNAAICSGVAALPLTST
jgi:hypothetical protein